MTRPDGAPEIHPRPRRVPPPSGARISAVIHTLDEEQNIGTAVRSATLVADEVIVADMRSADRTREIARELGARIVDVPPMDGVDPARARVMSDVVGDWVLVLDADEVIGPRLAAELRAIADAGAADAVRIPRITHMVGARIRGAGWSLPRERHLRFHRPDAVVYPEGVHVKPFPVEGARIAELPNDELAIVHFNYLGWNQFVARMNRYTSIHAREMHARGDIVARGSALRAAGHEVWDRLVRDRGYRDGYRGLVLALLMAAYQVLVFAKLRQLSEVGDEEQIARGYREEAERVLRGEIDG